MAGAFGTGRLGHPDLDQDGPRTTPQDALSEFTAKLSQVSGGTKRPGILPQRPTLPGQDHVTDPQSVRSNSLSAMDKLKSMVAARTAVSSSKTSVLPHRTPSPPKGEFIAGQKPVPTGPTAHEIMTHPAHQAVLKDVIATHEQANPGKALKAPGLMQLWNAKNPNKPLNEARARTVVAKVNKARDSYVQKQVDSFMKQGAMKTLKGKP